MKVAMIRLRQLQALSYVLSSRTMTAASELFGVTQPAMSRLIMQLEEEVGCKLLKRDRGRVRLTEEGERFYRKAEQVLVAMRELNGFSETLRHDPKGEVRIVSIYGLVSNLIPTAIAAFSADHPKIRISIDILNRSKLEEVIHEGQFDVALATLPVKSPAALSIDSLGTLPAICILPKGHVLARNKVVDAQDLAQFPFVSARRETLLRQRVDETFERVGVTRQLQFEAHNTEIMRQLVAAGFGVSVIHPFVQRPANDAFICRPFTPSILMEYALFRKPPGESSNAADVMAKYIIAETRHLGIPISLRLGKRARDALKD
ncbi:LysR family transcriptional regulator [Xanthobacter sediminis]